MHSIATATMTREDVRHRAGKEDEQRHQRQQVISALVEDQECT